MSDMEFFDKFTGKSVEDKLERFSEVYGVILLGLQRDMEAVSTKIEKIEKIEKVQERWTSIESELASQAERVRLLQFLSSLSCGAALCLGVVVWMLL